MESTMINNNAIMGYLRDICEQAKDELAYLAYTSKIENFVRDKLAYRLFTQNAESCVVARDWPLDNLTKNEKQLLTADESIDFESNRRKIDIAVLKSSAGDSLLLIELKATNTDSRKSGDPTHVKTHVKGLLKQLLDLKKTGKPFLGILLAVHPKNNLPEKDYSKKYHNYTGNDQNSLLVNYDNFIRNDCDLLHWKTCDKMEKLSLGVYKNCEFLLLVHLIF